MGRFRKTSYTEKEHFDGKPRFEHWYRDNTVYFITSKVRDGHHAFREERAKEIFWDRFTHWSAKYQFEPWVVSLLSNHYHIMGYLRTGENLGPFMQKLHGSVAKLVNDTLPERHLPFWRFAGNKDYFDGCLRDENQVRPHPRLRVKAGRPRRHRSLLAGLPAHPMLDRFHGSVRTRDRAKCVFKIRPLRAI